MDSQASDTAAHQTGKNLYLYNSYFIIGYVYKTLSLNDTISRNCNPIPEYLHQSTVDILGYDKNFSIPKALITKVLCSILYVPNNFLLHNSGTCI